MWHPQSSTYKDLFNNNFLFHSTNHQHTSNTLCTIEWNANEHMTINMENHTFHNKQQHIISYMWAWKNHCSIQKGSEKKIHGCVLKSESSILTSSKTCHKMSTKGCIMTMEYTGYEREMTGCLLFRKVEKDFRGIRS